MNDGSCDKSRSNSQSSFTRNGGSYRGDDGGPGKLNNIISRGIRVNSASIGYIMGKAGSNVKNIQYETGAKISVDKDNRSETTKIIISGTERAVTLAEQRINKMDYHWSHVPKRSGQKHDSRSLKRNDEQGSFDRDRNNDNQLNHRPCSLDNQSNFKDLTISQESNQKSATFLASLPPIIKRLYQEDPLLMNWNPDDVDEFRLQNQNISVSREFVEDEQDQLPIPKPVTTFEQAFLPYPQILNMIYVQKYTSLTPIQSQGWPVILSGEDMIGISKIGVDKTLTFLLPAIIHLQVQETPRIQRGGPTVICLTSTLDSALQIHEELNKFNCVNIRCICLDDGEDEENQITRIREEKPEMIIATPVRLNNLIQLGIFNLNWVSFIVLDEADKLLEMGFECPVRTILSNIRPDRQFIMTSVTWSSDLQKLASEYSVNPVQVVVVGACVYQTIKIDKEDKKRERDLAQEIEIIEKEMKRERSVAHGIEIIEEGMKREQGTAQQIEIVEEKTKREQGIVQKIEIIEEEKKRERLIDFLRSTRPEDKVIVFCPTKPVTDDIYSNLVSKEIPCRSLPGDGEVVDRKQALQDLKTGAVRILIATDVATCDLDFLDFTHVFDYDFPKNIEEYVRRIKEMEKAGVSGESISLVSRKDYAHVGDIIERLKEANLIVPSPLYKIAYEFQVEQRKKILTPEEFAGTLRKYANDPFELIFTAYRHYLEIYREREQAHK